jgi:hypothetical protein
MKKFILIFILIILAAGAAGYFGWVNIKPGSFGVAHSSITGTIEYPLESGKIHWLWQKLIPKSFQLYTVDKEPITTHIELSYNLPGSEQLQEFGRFELAVAANIEYSINFDAARLLIENGTFYDFTGLFKEQLSSQMEEIISSFILENLVWYSQNEREISFTMLDNLKERLEVFVSGAVRQYRLENASWNITYLELPQIALYNAALNRYTAHIEKVYRFKEEELTRKAEYFAKSQESDLEIERWRKYGELISQYPELLKYFYIQKFSEQADVLILPQEESTGFPRMLEPQEFFRKEFVPPEMEEPVQKGSIPEEEQPESPEDERAQFDLQEEEEEPPFEIQKKRWYETLMFWKNFRKQ